MRRQKRTRVGRREREAVQVVSLLPCGPMGPSQALMWELGVVCEKEGAARQEAHLQALARMGVRRVVPCGTEGGCWGQCYEPKEGGEQEGEEEMVEEGDGMKERKDTTYNWIAVSETSHQFFLVLAALVVQAAQEVPVATAVGVRSW